MTHAKAVILNVGSIRDLNAEASPRRSDVPFVEVSVDGDGDGAVKSQRFAAKYRILIDQQGAWSPIMSVVCSYMSSIGGLRHCERKYGWLLRVEIRGFDVG